MGPSQIQQKVTYRPRRTLEVFYTGGDVQFLSRDALACSCGDQVKVSHFMLRMVTDIHLQHGLFSRVNCKALTRVRGLQQGPAVSRVISSNFSI